MVIIENPASAPSHRLPPVIEKLFSAASRIVEAVMERGARTHRGEDWRTLPAGFHLARARRHLDLLAVGDVSDAFDHPAARSHERPGTADGVPRISPAGARRCALRCRTK
jgi:hypothetical protein